VRGCEAFLSGETSVLAFLRGKWSDQEGNKESKGGHR
jgi:hypothetical protein